MHVLLTEARFGDAGAAAARLLSAGAQVSTCHADSGLCRALAPGSRCPLDVGTHPVDFVVDVRGTDDELTESCAACGRTGLYSWWEMTR